MIYAIVTVAAFVEAAIISYYMVSVLDPKIGKRAAFLVIIAVAGVVTAAMAGLFSQVPVVRLIVCFVTYVMLLLFMFKAAYWKRFALLFSAYIITILSEQIGVTAGVALFSIDTPEAMASLTEMTPEYFLPFAVSLCIAYSINFLTVTAIAVPLWRRKFHDNADISVLPLALFVVAFVIAIAIFSTLSIQLQSGNNAIDSSLAVGAILFALCSIVFVVVYLGIALRHARQRQEDALIREQLAVQNEHHAQMALRYEKLRRLKHDFNNHVQVIKSLDNSGNLDEARSYFDRFSREFMSAEGVSFCGNPAVDAVLFHKQETLHALGVVTAYNVTMPEGCDIEVFDLCGIFSNLLDNAINACSAFDGDRFVKLETRIKSGCYVIVLKNSAGSGSAKSGGEGLSTRIIADIAN